MKIKKNNSLTVIFTGTSGSGKGTHAAKLVEDLGFRHISVGNLIRKVAQQKTPEGKEVKRIVMELGKLLPARQASNMLKAELETIPTDANLIIDGYPRTIDQIEHLDEMLAEAGRQKYLVINVYVADDVAIERLSKRLVCSECKKNFKENGMDIVQGAECPNCAGILRRRADDTPKKVIERLAWSHKEVEPVIAEFSKRGNIVDVDGGQDIEKVYRQILDAIEKHI